MKGYHFNFNHARNVITRDKNIPYLYKNTLRWKTYVYNMEHRSMIDMNQEMNPHVKIASSTHNWYENIVRGTPRLCPFAPPSISSSSSSSSSNTAVTSNSKLRIVTSDAKTEEDAIDDVKLEANLLFPDIKNKMDKTIHETTLIVFDESIYPAIKDFRSFVRLSWQLQSYAIIELGLHTDLQLVLFHPNASHDTYTERLDTDAADYTIRSPYPTVHLLREADVMMAVTSGYPNLNELPERNKAKLRELGIQVCQSRLNQCKEN